MSVSPYVIPDNLQSELRDRFNPDGSLLRNCQLRMLELLQFLDKTCRRHNLKYWLDSGTLIGAARHGGFIPWDDDVDVCMMRSDADKLLQILGNKVHEGHIVLQSHLSDPHYVNPSWMTIRDTKSEFRTDSYYHQKLKYKGLQVDIFIIEQGLNPRVLELTRLLHSFFVLSPLLGRHGLSLLRPFAFFNYRWLTNFLYPLLRRISPVDDTHTSSGPGAVFTKIQEYSTIFPLSQISFEGYEFYAPHDVDKYLTTLFGNWRQIPDIASNLGHDARIFLYE